MNDHEKLNKRIAEAMGGMSVEERKRYPYIAMLEGKIPDYHLDANAALEAAAKIIGYFKLRCSFLQPYWYAELDQITWRSAETPALALTALIEVVINRKENSK